MKKSALIAVAASCGLLAAASAGLASWAVVSVSVGATPPAIAGDDGVFVGDELNELLLTREQLEELGVTDPPTGSSADYGPAPIEADPLCAHLIGQQPLHPAGVRALTASSQEGYRVHQSVVQFATPADAAAEFAAVAEASGACAAFDDDFGRTYTWTTVVSSEQPALISGFSEVDGGAPGVTVIGRSANAVSYIFASTEESGLSPAELARTIAAASADRLVR